MKLERLTEIFKMDKRISLTIAEICAKLDIDYKSINPNYLQMIDDAKRLAEIYRDLKIIAGDLDAIADRNEIPELKNILHDDAAMIDKLDHEIIRVAQRIKDND